MNEETAFLEAIAKSPADRTARLAFADWLQERDDPRAPWVRDDELWEWMKPNAKDPTRELLAATARIKEGHKTVQALARIGLSVLPKVLALLRKPGGSARNLQAVLAALGPSAEPELPLLLASVKDPNHRVRVGAFRCLMGLVRVCPQAMELALASIESPDLEIRKYALEACAVRGTRDGLPAPAPDPVHHTVERLHAVVRTGDDQAAAAALNTLFGLGGLDEALIPALLARLTTMKQYSATGRGEVIDALSRLGEPGAVALLKAAEHFEDRDSRLESAFDRLGVVAVGPLREALSSPHAGVRHLATIVLARRVPELGSELIPALIALFQSPESTYHSVALEVLFRFGRAAAPMMPALLACLERGDSFVRSRPEMFLQMGMSADVVVPAMLRAVRTVRTEQARWYAGYLDRLGHGLAVLLHAVSRSGPDARAQAVEVLSSARSAEVAGAEGVLNKDTGGPSPQFGEPARLALDLPPDEAAAAVRPFLSDKASANRLSAIYALWYIKTPEAVAGLLAALKDKDQVLRITALRALGRVGRGAAGAVEAVRAMLTDRAKDVRDAAMPVLVELQREGE
jgi:uncharacterized protein (TIGR02996 family)